MSTDIATPGPVSESERLQALDVLRGFAVLGILVMNIGAFAMPLAAYLNPLALGEPSTSDFVIWSVLYVLADLKFMTIFSLLFGAGVLLMTTRAAARGAGAALLHYRRMGWLLVFGLIHAYLLWWGDILVPYAICGMAVYLLRRLQPRVLLAVAVGVFAVGSLLMVGAGLTMESWPIQARQQLLDNFWQPPPERIAREIAAFQGDWSARLAMQAGYAREFHTFDIWVLTNWRVAGLMLLGMALLKWRVLTGEREVSFYTRLAAVGFGIGLPLVIVGLMWNTATGWNMRDGFFLVAQWNYWGSVLVSLGWIGLVLRLWKAGVAGRLFRRLAAAGRMAFTCYILETLICTTVFYGFGFGLFGTVDRMGQMLVVVAVWAFLLVFAPWWLERFRFGPLEWLWRTLTYGRRESIRRQPPRAAAAL